MAQRSVPWLYDELQRINTRTDAAVTALYGDVQLLLKERENLKRTVKMHQKDLAALRAQMTSSDAVHVANAEALRTSIQEQQAVISQLKSEISSLTSDAAIKSAQAASQLAVAEQAEVDAKAAHAAEVLTLRQEIKEANERVASLTDHLAKERKALVETKKETRSVLSQLEDRGADVEAVRSLLTKVQSDLDDARRAIVELRPWEVKYHGLFDRSNRAEAALIQKLETVTREATSMRAIIRYMFKAAFAQFVKTRISICSAHAKLSSLYLKLTAELEKFRQITIPRAFSTTESAPALPTGPGPLADRFVDPKSKEWANALESSVAKRRMKLRKMLVSVKEVSINDLMTSIDDEIQMITEPVSDLIKQAWHYQRTGSSFSQRTIDLTRNHMAVDEQYAALLVAHDKVKHELAETQLARDRERQSNTLLASRVTLLIRELNSVHRSRKQVQHVEELLKQHSKLHNMQEVLAVTRHKIKLLREEQQQAHETLEALNAAKMSRLYEGNAGLTANGSTTGGTGATPSHSGKRISILTPSQGSLSSSSSSSSSSFSGSTPHQPPPAQLPGLEHNKLLSVDTPSSSSSTTTTTQPSSSRPQSRSSFSTAAGGGGAVTSQRHSYSKPSSQHIRTQSIEFSPPSPNVAASSSANTSVQGSFSSTSSTSLPVSPPKRLSENAHDYNDSNNNNDDDVIVPPESTSPTSFFPSCFIGTLSVVPLHSNLAPQMFPIFSFSRTLLLLHPHCFLPLPLLPFSLAVERSILTTLHLAQDASFLAQLPAYTLPGRGRMHGASVAAAGANPNANATGLNASASVANGAGLGAGGVSGGGSVVEDGASTLSARIGNNTTNNGSVNSDYNSDSRASSRLQGRSPSPFRKPSPSQKVDGHQLAPSLSSSSLMMPESSSYDAHHLQQQQSTSVPQPVRRRRRRPAGKIADTTAAAPTLAMRMHRVESIYSTYPTGHAPPPHSRHTNAAPNVLKFSAHPHYSQIHQLKEQQRRLEERRLEQQQQQQQQQPQSQPQQQHSSADHADDDGSNTDVNVGDRRKHGSSSSALPTRALFPPPHIIVDHETD